MDLGDSDCHSRCSEHNSIISDDRGSLCYRSATTGKGTATCRSGRVPASPGRSTNRFSTDDLTSGIFCSSCWRIAALSSRDCSTTLRTSLAVSLRSEEHTSELQSHLNLVCRLLLEKKKKKTIAIM